MKLVYALLCIALAISFLGCPQPATQGDVDRIVGERIDPLIAPTAAVTASFRWASLGLTVQFTDLSTGNPNRWTWNFGDLSPLSASQNPLYTYPAAGTYEVRLLACRDDVCDEAPALVTVAP